MRNIILTIALLCSFVANAYEPMIREDRIWEYSFDYEAFYWDETWQKLLYFKFDGTEEVNGKTYNKLTLWSDELDLPLQTVALMREVDNYVYILLEQETLNNENSETATEYIEALLYDFHANSDSESLSEEDYNSTTIMSVAYYYDEEGHPMEGWYVCDFITPELVLNSKLESVLAYYRSMKVELNGKEWHLREFVQSPEEFKYAYPYKGSGFINNTFSIRASVETVIEGVGPVGKGMPHRPWITEISMLAGHMSSRWIALSRLTDLDGNTIFDTKWLNDSDGVEEVVAPEQETDGASYDLSGKRVVNPEPGTIYIQDGKKHIAH